MNQWYAEPGVGAAGRQATREELGTLLGSKLTALTTTQSQAEGGGVDTSCLFLQFQSASGNCRFLKVEASGADPLDVRGWQGVNAALQPPEPGWSFRALADKDGASIGTAGVHGKTGGDNHGA